MASRDLTFYAPSVYKHFPQQMLCGSGGGASEGGEKVSAGGKGSA